VPDETGVYRHLGRVRFDRADLAVEVSLVLSCMGEESAVGGLDAGAAPVGSAGPARRGGCVTQRGRSGHMPRDALDAKLRETPLRTRVQLPVER
jgi:hypothetical protein